VHGSAFAYIEASGNPIAFKAMLQKAQVFARMLPKQKRTLIDSYEIVLDVYAGMCGDGANDAAALKTARVGLSLGESEASIAAPFTSTVGSIRSVCDLLKEGRCAISTSFALFKFMALYSLINFATVLFLYVTWCDFSDWEFFYLDLVLIIPMAFAISRMRASFVLAPVQPVDSLVSYPVIGSILAQVAVQVACLMAIYFWGTFQPWYVAPETWDEVVYNTHPVAIVFLFSNFQYLIVALVFAAPSQHHRSMWKSPLVVLVTVWVFASNVFLLFQNFPIVSEFFELPHGGGDYDNHNKTFSSSTQDYSNVEPYYVNPAPIPSQFRWCIAGVAVVNLILSVVCEEAMQTWIPSLSAALRRRYKATTKKKTKQKATATPRTGGFISGGPLLQYVADSAPTAEELRKGVDKGKLPAVKHAPPSERSALLWHPQRSTRDIRVTITDDDEDDSGFD